MAEIFHARFTSGLDSFSAGSQVTTKGSADIADAAGALQIAAGVTANRDFTNITTGKSRLDFSYRLEDSSVVASSSTLVYMMENGVAPASGSSLCTIALSRFDSSTGSLLKITYCNNAGAFVSIPSDGGNFEIRRGAWWIKIGMVLDHTAKTFDLYIEDVLFVKSAPWPNSSAAGFGRVSISAQASAPDTWFDNIRVQDAWGEGESVLIDHTFVGGSGEIEASIPGTSSRQAHAQPWYIAPDTSLYGGFTLGANGAQPDASRKSFALQRCGENGVIEAEFRTSVSGVAYFGIIFRFWDYPTATNGGGGVIRASGSGNTVALFLPNRAGVLTSVQSTALTLLANTTYTLRLEMRGRVLIASYKAAAMESGSYTTLFTHTVNSSATGGRGMLIEELAGPFIDTAVGATDNYVRRFRYTGKPDSSETVKTIGTVKYGLSHGSVKEIYFTAAVQPTRNLFFSRGIQFGHRSSADMCGNQQQQIIYDQTNVFVSRQTGSNLTEYQHLGLGDCYVTLLRRGPWVSDGITPFDTSENFAPDWDLLPTHWSTAFRSIVNTGASTSRSDATYHDWIAHNSGATLPAGHQSITAFGSGQNYTLSEIVLADVGGTGAVWDVTSKFEGNGDPISRAVSTSGTNLTAGSSFRAARAFLVRAENALSDTVFVNWRDDLKTPATLTFSSGSLKTNAAGDTNADGFNERHGWYEIQCASGDAAWTLPVSAGIKYMPVFRLHGFTTKTALNINGSPATAGTDFTLDTVESGIVVLQLLGDFAASATFALADGGVTLTGNNSTQANTSSTGSITSGPAVLTGQNSTQSNTSSTGSISTDSTVFLSGSSATQSNNSSTGAISIPSGSTTELTGANSTQENQSSSGAIYSESQSGLNIMNTDAITILNKAIVQLNDAGSVHWTPSELLGWLNDGQLEIATLVPNSNASTITKQLIAGSKQDAASIGITDCIRFVEFIRNMGAGSTPGIAIRQIDKQDLSAYLPDWAVVSLTNPASATVKHVMYNAEDDNQTFYVWPPQPSSGMGYIELIYAKIPTAIANSNAGTKITIADYYANALLDYVLYRAFGKDSEAANQAARSQSHYQAFASSIGIKGMADQNANNTKAK